MDIRIAKIEDLEEISILIKQVSDLHYEARKNTFKLKKRSNISKYVETVITDSNVKVVVAEDEKMICRSGYM